jgi:hypothetical protein
MALQESVAVRNAKLDAHETTIGTAPILRLLELNGAIPADCATAQTGTVVSNITLPTDWMGNAATGAKVKAGTWQGTASASGQLNYWRLYDSAGTTCHYQGQIARAHTVSTAYLVGQRVTNVGNCYRCTVAGTTGAASPPTHTAGAVVDGTATWTYETDAGGVMVPDTFAVSSGQTITVSTFTVSAQNT